MDTEVRECDRVHPSRISCSPLTLELPQISPSSRSLKFFGKKQVRIPDMGADGSVFDRKQAKSSQDPATGRTDLERID